MDRLAAILLAATLSFTAGAQTEDALVLDRLGREAIIHGEPEVAAEHFEKAIELKPNDAARRYQLANAYLQAGMRSSMFGAMSLAKKAKVELERAIHLDPDLIPARFALLEFHVSAPGIIGGSESAAMEQASEIRKRDAIDGHRAFARIHTAAKNLDLARKEYVDMMKAQPTSARAHYFFGVYLMLTEKNYKAASNELETALRIDPSYMPTYFRIGLAAALAADNFALGEGMLKKYLAYRPRDDEPSIARAYYWLGTIYEKQGKRAEARSNYAASLKINPNQEDVGAAMKR